MAVQSKTILKGGLHFAVMANVLGSNPVRDVSPIRSKTRPKGAPALTADELRGLLAKLRASEACQRHDLVDPITLFIATGLRISELLGCMDRLRRDGGDADGHRQGGQGGGQGPAAVDETKTAAGAGRCRCRRSR